MEGGEPGPDNDIVAEWLDSNGAVVMGALTLDELRRAFPGY